MTRNRKYIEKLKLTGNFIAFKQKKAEYEKARRKRLKDSLAQLNDSQRTHALRQDRQKSLARVQKYRQKKRQSSDPTQKNMVQQITSSCVKTGNISDSSMDNHQSDASSSGNDRTENETSSEQCITSSYSPSQRYVAKSSRKQSNFKTEAELEAAVAKVERSLPSSPSKRKAVIAALFYELDEESQREIIRNIATLKRTGHKRIGTDWIKKIHKFYERDGISRMSANADDLINFVDPSTLRKELRRIRHLVHTLKQAYALFMKENTGEL